MKRFAIIVLVIGVLSGCSGAAPTPAPTQTSVPSAAPAGSRTPVPSAAATATSTPTVAPQAATPAPSEIAPGITEFTPYTSEAYGYILGYPDGWTLLSAATRKWQGGDQDAGLYADWFMNPESVDGEQIALGVWQQPTGAGDDITSYEGLAAWFEANLCDSEFDACENVLEVADLMCVSVEACLPAIVVPLSEGTVAVLADNDAGLVTVASLGRHDDFPATARYGGGVQLLKSILTTMDVWTAEPEPTPDQSATIPVASGARPLLVDTDVAPDDLVAIAFLLSSPNVDIRAITVSGTGEAHCEGGVETVHGLLERLGAPAIEVACGRETPIAGDHSFPDEWRAAVDDGSGLELPSHSRQPFDGTAVELIETTSQDSDELRVLTLGPMTNLADALGSNPELAARLESVYAMGGALFVPGNVGFGGPPDNQVAEWNIYVDPNAAQAVIDSGVPVRLISLDGTSQVPVAQEFAQRVAEEATGPGAQVLAELFAEHPFMTDGTYFLWDPLAAALAADFPLGEFSPARVDVEEIEGPEVGFTRPIDGTPNVEYLSSADRAAAEDTLLETLN